MNSQKAVLRAGLNNGKIKKPENKAAVYLRLAIIKQLEVGYCSIAFKKQRDLWLLQMTYLERSKFGETNKVTPKLIKETLF